MSDETISADVIASMETLSIVLGSLSVLGGLSILATVACFPMMMWRDKASGKQQPAQGSSRTVSTASVESTTTDTGPKRELNTYVHMIIMLAICETLAAFGFAWGFPIDPDVCIAQGILVQFFQRAKWTWNALIGYQLYRFMVHDRKGFSTLQMHAACWTFCIVLELAPLTNGIAYGGDDEYRGTNMCYYTQTPGTLKWTILMYFVPLVMAVAVMIYVAYQLWVRFRYLDSLAVQTPASVHIKRLVRTMIMYPVALLVTTFPNMIVFFISSVNKDGTWAAPKVQYITGVCCFAWSFSYGMWLSIIFFVNSQEAKRRWRSFLCGADYVDMDNRLVRGSQSDVKATKDAENIHRSMNAALGGGSLAGGTNFSMSRNRDSFGSSKSGSVSQKVQLSKTVEASGSSTGAGTSKNSLRLGLGASSGLVGTSSNASSPVFTSHSAVYDEENPINIDDDTFSSHATPSNPLHE